MLKKLGYFARPIQSSASTNTTTPWLPTDLSSLIGWWDAGDTATIHEDDAAGRVSQWDDKSGNGNHLSCSVSANQPVTNATTLNGANTIQFGQSAAHYLSPDGALTGDLPSNDSQNISIHIVFRQDTTVSQGAAVSMRTQIGGDALIPDFNTLNRGYYPGEANAYQIENPTSMPRGSEYLLGFNANLSDVEIYNNGSLIFNLGSGQNFDSFNRFLLGFRASSSKLWIGEIAEVVVAESLSVADRQALEGYLANKWGI